MNYLIKDDLTLSFYQYDYIENNFIKLIIDLCQKYPFKFNFLIKEVFSSSEITYIKDTTMIINLNYFSLTKQQYIFDFIRSLLNIKTVEKVIAKKEFLIIHLHSHKISEFFIYPTRWLGYIFYDVFRSIYIGDQCLLGVLISNQHNQSSYVDLYLERLGTPFIIYCDRSKYLMMHQSNIKKIYLFASNAQAFAIDDHNDSGDMLYYRFNNEKFKKSVKKYFDNPCNLIRFIV